MKKILLFLLLLVVISSISVTAYNTRDLTNNFGTLTSSNFNKVIDRLDKKNIQSKLINDDEGITSTLLEVKEKEDKTYFLLQTNKDYQVWIKQNEEIIQPTNMLKYSDYKLVEFTGLSDSGYELHVGADSDVYVFDVITQTTSLSSIWRDNFARNNSNITKAVTDGLVYYFKLNGDGYDTITGVMANNKSATSDVGRFGNSAGGMYFNGTAYINESISTNKSFDIVKGHTISYWIKTAQLGTFDYHVELTRDINARADPYMDTANNVICAMRVGATSKSAIINGYPLVTNRWYHIVQTNDNVSLKCYLDGVLRATGESNYSVSVNHTEITLGVYGSDKVSNPFNGTMDNVKIYNRPISAEEVKALYGERTDNQTNGSISQVFCIKDCINTTDLIEQWMFNNTLNGLYGRADASGINITLNNNCRYGQCYTFNNSSNVDVLNRTYLNSSTFTISLWINPTNVTTPSALVTNLRDDGGNYGGWGLVMNVNSFECGTNEICMWISNNTGNGKWAYYDTPSYVLKTNEWQHLLVSFDENTKNLTFYVNGISIWSEITLYIPRFESNSSFHIGYQTAITRPFYGSMDNIMLWNRSLGANEIYKLYLSGYEKYIANTMLLKNITYSGDVSSSCYFFNTTNAPFNNIYNINNTYNYSQYLGYYSNQTNPTMTSYTSGQKINIGADYGMCVAYGTYLNYFNISMGEYVAPPVVEFSFVSQLPPDINITNILGQNGLNITYSVFGSDLNETSVRLYYKNNKTTSNVAYYENGTAFYGYFETTQFSNVSDIKLFRLFDNSFLSASYNFNERNMETAVKTYYSFSGANNWLSMEFLNVSNTSQFSFFEINFRNITTTSNVLPFYACNSSYITGSPLVSPFCSNFYTMQPTQDFDHCHSNTSCHKIAQMTINTITGTIGSVKITPKMYIIIRGNTNVWNITTINNISRKNAYRISTNSGVSYSNLSFIVDAHIHQFDGTDSLYYYVCAKGNNNETQYCDSTRQDLLQLGGLPPNVFIITPVNPYFGNSLFISYTATSPNSYSISNYTIELLNLDGTLNKTILNYTNNTSYLWNTSSIQTSIYRIRVNATDTLSQMGSSLSNPFTFDRINPNATLLIPSNGSWETSANVEFTFILNDTLSGIKNYTLYVYNNNTNLSFTQETGTFDIFDLLGSMFVNLFNGIYSWFIEVFDFADNSYISTTNEFEVINFDFSLCNSTDLQMQVTYPLYCDINVTCGVDVTLPTGINYNNTYVLFTLGNNTQASRSTTNIFNLFFMSQMEEKIDITFQSVILENNEFNCSQNKTININFKPAFYVDIRLFRKGIFNTTYNYKNDFNYLYLIYTNSTTQPISTISSLDNTNAFLKELSNLNEKVYKIKTPTRGNAQSADAIYFWGKYDNGKSRIKLYEKGGYNLYIINSGSDLNLSFNEFERPALESFIYDTKLFTGVNLTKTTTWNLMIGKMTSDWVALAKKILISIGLILFLFVIHLIVFGIGDKYVSGFGAQMSGMLALLTIPLFIFFIIITWVF